jgi:hypothetical protein
MAKKNRGLPAQEGNEEIEAEVEADDPSYQEDLDAQEQAAKPRSKYFARRLVDDFGGIAFGDGTVRVAASSRAIFYLILLLAIIIPPLVAGVGTTKRSLCIDASRSYTCINASRITSHNPHSTSPGKYDVPPDKPGATKAIVFGAMGWFLGPCLIIYGYKIRDLLVVFNSLISSGLYEWMDQMFLLPVVSPDESGRFMPEHGANLFLIVCLAFSLSAAAFSNTKLKNALRGGVIANLWTNQLIIQLDSRFGCICYDTIHVIVSHELQRVQCTPLVNEKLYILEPECFYDKWFRYLLKSACILTAAYMSPQMASFIDKGNSAMVGSDLLNEAVFATLLTTYTEKAAEYMPYKATSLSVLTLIGMYFQSILQQMDQVYLDKKKRAELHALSEEMGLTEVAENMGIGSLNNAEEGGERGPKSKNREGENENESNEEEPDEAPVIDTVHSTVLGDALAMCEQHKPKLHVLPETYCYWLFFVLYRWQNAILGPLLWMDAAVVSFLGGSQGEIIEKLMQKVDAMEARALLDRQNMKDRLNHFDEQLEIKLADIAEKEVVLRRKAYHRKTCLRRCIYSIMMGERSTRVTLVSLNLLMMAIGLAFLAQGASVYEHGVAVLFATKEAMDVLMYAGCSMYVVSICGFFASRTGATRYLVPYLIMLSAVILAQLYAGALFYEEHHLHFDKAATTTIRSSMEAMYTGSQCSTFVSPRTNGTLALPMYSVMCENDVATDFFNGQCSLDGASDTSELLQNMDLVLNRTDYRQAEVVSVQLRRAQARRNAVKQCLRELGVTIEDVSGSGTWCACKATLLHRVNLMQTLCILCLVSLLIEVVMLYLALKLHFLVNARRKREIAKKKASLKAKEEKEHHKVLKKVQPGLRSRMKQRDEAICLKEGLHSVLHSANSKTNWVGENREKVRKAKTFKAKVVV